MEDVWLHLPQIARGGVGFQLLIGIVSAVDKNRESVARQHFFEGAARHAEDLAGFSAGKLAIAVQCRYERFLRVAFIYVEVIPIGKVDGHVHGNGQSVESMEG